MSKTMRIPKYFLLFPLFALSSFGLLGQSLDVTTSKKNSCAGANNGSVTITVDNTTTTVGPYSYLIFGIVNSNGPYTGSLTKGSAKTISNLPPDNYLVSVSDGDGTVANFSSFSLIVDTSPSISLSSTPTVVNNSNCSSPDGSITISPTGGSGSYTYSWTGPGSFTATTQNLSGLSGGSYVVVIGDNNANCTFTSSAIVVSDPLPNAFTISTPDNTLCNGDNLTINLQAPAPESGVTYTVEVDGTLTGSTFAGSSLSFSGLSIGSHTVRVKAALGSCTPIFNSAPNISVTVFSNVSVSTSQVNVTCNAGADGSITVTASGGSGAGYTYSKDNGTSFQAGNSFSGLTAGTYQIVVKDGNGCLSTATPVTITQPVTVTFTTAKVDVTGCFGNTNGSITVTASGGSGAGYTYSKDNGTSFQASNVFSSLGAGTYQIVVKDGNGCLSTASPVTITQPTALTLTNSGNIALNCFGDTNGSGTFTASGGTSPYTFSINSNTTGGTITSAATTATLSGAGVGSITVKVTDANGCTATSTITVTQPASALSLNNSGNIALNCFGDTNGSGTFTASGGTSPYTFSVNSNTTGGTTSTTATQLNLTGAGVGSITVKVTDANGCTATSTITVTQPASALVLNNTGDVALNCFGDTNGSGTFTASGGTSPYTFAVNSNTTGGTTTTTATTLSLTGAGVGSITVKVTDAKGCTTTSTINVTQPASALALTNTGNVALNCFGDTNGSGTFTAAGGTSPYTFAVNSNTTGGTTATTATTLSLTGAGVGSITVKVTDAKGCTTTSTITVTQPASALLLNNSGNITLNCFGDTNGTGTFTASGGTSPYTFAVNSNTTGGTTTSTATQVSLTGAGAGSITIQVTDAKGCTATSTITVTQPASALVLSNTGNIALNCFGDTNGTGTFTAAGGTSPYTFTVNSNTTGGTTTTTATTLSLTGAGIGSITVKVTDAKGCTSTSTINITQPASALSLNNSGNIALNCFGDTNGTGSFTASGGTSPYTFSVNSNTTGGTTSTTATQLNLTGAGVGSITVKVTDANGCTATSTITVTQPASALVLNNTGDVALNCFGDTNGSGTFTASGGTSPYTFAVNSNTTGGTTTTTATTLSLTGAGVGSITVKVTDAKGCTTTSTINVTQPASALALTNTGDVALNCFGDTNGSGTFTAAGGTSPYTFTVNSNTTGGTTTATATTLSLTGAGIGSITVKVTDAKGCTSTSTINITQPASALSLNNSGNIALNCFGDTNGTGSFTASGGTSPYTFSVNSNTTGGTTSTTATQLNLTGAGVGSITVKVTDANGCTATSTITVTQPGALVLNNTGNIALNCFGDTNGAGSFTVSGGTAPFTFVVTSNTTGATTTPAATTLSFTGAGIGTISIQVTDAKSCTTTSSITVTQPASALLLTNTGDVALNCFGDTTGAGTFTASGGTAPYTFAVNSNTTGGTTTTNATQLDLTGAGVGSITVKVTDAKGCTTTSTINVTQPASALALNNSGNISLNCFGDTNGSGTFTASGGTSPYTFTINSNTTGGTTTNTATTLSLTGAGVGSITVKVTDANGCTSTSTITVTQPLAISAVINGTATICAGTSTNLSVTITGGTAPFTVVYSDGSTNTTVNSYASGSNISVSPATSKNYTLVSVTDANGCTSGSLSGSAAVTVNPVPSAPTVTTPVKYCKNDVAVALTATGSNLLWYNAPTGGVGSGTAPTPSTATVGSTNFYVTQTVGGCESARSLITVTINALPTASITGTASICNGSSTGLSISLTGTGPWDFTYSVTDVNGTTNVSLTGQSSNPFNITVSPTLTTTYAIVSVKDANCTGSATGSSAVVTVNNPPDITLGVSANVSPLCSGNATTIDVANSENGVSYQLRNGSVAIGSPVIGNGSTINLPTGNLSATTTFNVLATAGGCPAAQLTNTATVTVAGSINSSLAVTAQSSPVCSGSGTNIQVAASEVGVNYQLRDASNSNVGSAVAGTGGTIDLPTGNLTATTTFNVLASNATCSAQLTTTATVNVDINPDPNLTLGSTVDPVCATGSSAVTVANSEVGVSYQLRDNATNNPVGTAVAGTGGTINLPTGALAATTTYNVLATGGAACPSVQMTSTVTITVSGAINTTLAITPQAASVCSGSGTNIQVANSEVGIDYQLRDNSNNPIGTPVSGTGATINLPTGNLTAATTFNVLATNGTCSIQMTNTASVNVDINPNISLATSADVNPVCTGGSVNIQVANSENGVSYQLRDASNTNIGSPVTGNGGTISLPTGALAANTTFNVLATSGTCIPVQLTNTVSVTVGGTINNTLTVAAQSPSICSGSATNIQVSASEIGVNYQLRDNSNNSAIGSVVIGTGGTIDLPTGNLATTTTFNVLASNGTCSIQLTSTPTVTVNPVPNASLSVTAQSSSICTGTSTNIQVANSELGVSYQLRDNSNNANIGSAVAGTGGTINLPTGNLTANTTFNVFASTASSCSAQLTTTPSVTVNPLPNAGLTVTALAASVCSGSSTSIQVANSEVGVSYQLRDNSNNSNIGSAVTGTGATISLSTGNLSAATTFNVLASIGTCSVQLTTTPSVSVNASPTASLTVTAQNGSVCTGTGTNIRVVNSEVGVSYQLRDNSNNNAIGSAVAGTGGTINLPTGSLTASTTYNVLATNTTTTCAVQLTSTVTVSVLLASDPLCGGSGGTNCGAFTINVTDSRPTCSGQDDGKITISVTGGTPNYVVTLFDATQSFSQALAGPGPFQFINLSPSLNYQYKVEDGAGNVCTLPYSLPIQTNVQATASGFVDAKCFNQAVGQATITVTSGGTSPYEYSLDAGTTWISFTSPFTITNLMPAPAPYSILVRDGASDLCPAQVSVSISNAVADISINATSTDATCSNNDGQFQVSSVSGGTSPYTYQVDGVATTNLSITGLSGGSHIFTVTDANSCTKNFPFTINFPGLVNFTTGVFNPTCAGSGSDGAVLVTITSSGTFQAGITTDPSNPPATFQNVVSSGSSTVTFSGLSKNTYYVYVQATGALCPTKSSVTVSAGPDAVDFSFINKDIKCFEDKGGVRVFAFKGAGTVSYSYEVLNSGSIVQSGTITQLQALDTVDIVGFGNGDYQIRLFQDQSATTGCTAIISSAYKSFTLSGPAAPLDTLYVNRTISFPDLATGTMLVGISESQEEPYEVRIELTTPLLPGQAKLIDWTVATRNTQNLKVEYAVSNLFAGGYRLSIRDGLGCVKNYDINLDVDTNIFIPNIFTPNGDGSNETFYIRNLPANSSLSVTNRWGNEVFSSSNYNGLWNGGAESDGVYYYRLVVAGGKIYNGWVEIMRGSTK
jgi:gliding motility-associated-like protein